MDKKIVFISKETKVWDGPDGIYIQTPEMKEPKVYPRGSIVLSEPLDANNWGSIHDDFWVETLA